MIVHVYQTNIIDLWGAPDEDRDIKYPNWLLLSGTRGVDWFEFWADVALVARELGWEGDIRGGPYLCYLPWSEYQDGERPFVVGWKQNNNGLTFLASKYRLPWLETDGIQHAMTAPRRMSPGE